MNKFISRIKIRHIIILFSIPLFVLILEAFLEYKNILGNLNSSFIWQYADIITLLLIVIVLKNNKLSLREFIGESKNKINKTDFVLNLVAQIIFSIGILIVIGYIIQSLGLINLDELESDQAIARGTIHTLVAGAILAPIVEELLFRGMLMNKLKIKIGVSKALILSSIIFSLAHFDGLNIGYFTFGLITGVMYIKTKSLLAPILIHMSNNLILLLFLNQPDNSAASSSDELISLDVFIFILILTLAAALRIFYYLRKNWPTEIKGEVDML